MLRLERSRRSPAVALAVVTLAIFADMFIYSLVVPILPGYGAALGASQAAIGFLFGSEAAYGAAYALFNMAYAAGLLGGPVVGGVLAERFGFPAAGAIGGVLLLLYTLPFLVSRRRAVRPRGGRVP